MRIIGLALAMILGGGATAVSQPFTTDGRIKAMLSIHAHAQWPNGNFPDGVAPIPLADAVTFLENDPDRLAPSRRRRAIAKLAGYGLSRPDFADAIRRLGGDPAAIKEALHRQRTILGATRRNAAERERIVNDLTNVTGTTATTADTPPGMAAPDCIWRQLVYSAWGDGPDFAASTTLEVNRDVATVARAVDPQSWDECSKFWAPPPDGAYLAKTDASGTLQRTTGGDIVKDPPLPAGSAYGSAPARYLVERFSCQVPGCDAWFLIQLRVGTQWDTTPHRYLVWYGLAQWLDGQVLGQTERIITDWGDITATAGSGTLTTVKVLKHLGYQSASLTATAQAVLAQTEAAAEFAEVVCCAVPGSH